MRIYVRGILNHKAFVFATLIVWLLASWSGAHGHMCFDGQEPPITVHIHGANDHAGHDSSEQHVDADMNLNQPLLTKLTNLDLPLLIAATLLLAILFEKLSFTSPDNSQAFTSRRLGLRPPLRAPPVFPA